MARVTGRWIGAVVLAAALGLAGCEVEEAEGTRDVAETGGDPGTDPGADAPEDIPADTPREPLAIAGSYTDGFGGQHAITQATWTQAFAGSAASVFNLSQWDNGAKWVTAQNDAANGFNPGLWSRFDWTTFQDALYFCQTRYDAASEAEALAATAADPADPTTAGCAGFAWTALTPVP